MLKVARLLLFCERPPRARSQSRSATPHFFALTYAALLASLSISLPAELCAEDETVDFNVDIRPILSDNCYQCHGPDEKKRQANLRLDTEAGAFADLGGYFAVVAGHPTSSELYRRVSSSDPDERMPPPSAERQLSDRQIALLKRWIEEGAKWEGHWSFVPPKSPEPPRVRDQHWLRNPIDAFVLARLEAAGLEPSPEAQRTTLIRRASFDLTGLPPTPADVETFLADESPQAFANVVDRLLASPRYGERMAFRWLEASRYADTNGYQSDGERSMWRWRDWVIDAFNDNMPFDQFTVEQLAGDLLPAPTLEQRIATGFNRNHRGNGEGGVIAEEYLVEYVVDRVDTTATVWMGLTMNCARCHDHKYDPISQQDFYGVFAFFHNVPERGKAVKYGNSAPMIPAPTREQQRQLAAHDDEIARAGAKFDSLSDAIDTAQAEWERGISSQGDRIVWAPTDDLVVHVGLDDTLAVSAAFAAARRGAVFQTEDPAGGDAAREAGSSLEVEPTWHGGQPAFVSGRIDRAAQFDGSSFVDVGDVGKFGFYDKFTCAAWINLQSGASGGIVTRMPDARPFAGYNFHVEDRKLQANFVRRWLDDAIRVETVERLDLGRWYHVAMTYDGSRTAAGVKIYVDGVEQPLKVHVDELNQSFETDSPLRIGARGKVDFFHGSLDEVRVYGAALSAAEVSVVAAPDSIDEIAAIPAAERTARQQDKLRAHFLSVAAPQEIRDAHRRVRELIDARAELVESFPTTMVMQERSEPRTTHVLIRGEYDKPGEIVEPGVPKSLPPIPAGAPMNRLGLARWIVDPSHPLTARVVVNRIWQMYFGRGLVKTVEDFGSQGDRPTHPKLLDWLATELVRSGWNLKSLHRTIVTSATYRQTSRVTPERVDRDPGNELLGRGPRFRLSAPMIRDQALAVSGLLVERAGGPSVKPYQPPGLWKEVSGYAYVSDTGEGLYRRSLYTFWKRTVAPPTMTTFDASGREACAVRETRTNTPLQALALMNDVTFVEAARVLAERTLKQAETPAERLRFAFRLATARLPNDTELAVLGAGLEAHLDSYRSDPAAADSFTSIGDSPRDGAVDVPELAAYTAVCSLILNLDEVVTKE